MVATDGSCLKNGEEDARAGAGVFYEANHLRNRSVKVPPSFIQSNQSAELLALKEAVEGAPEEGRLMLELDSKYTLGQVTKSLRHNEDSGYIGISNPELVKLAVARLRARKYTTRMKWVKGHAGHARNEGADRLARAAVDAIQTQNVTLNITPSLSTSGAKLSAVTQALAYKAIRAKKMEDKENSRARTDRNLDRVKMYIKSKQDSRPTTGKIWRRIRNKDFSRQERFWLWMSLHDAYWVGSHWLKPQFEEEYRDRAICAHDGCVETMEHILTECGTPGQREIWEDTKNLWERQKAGPWSTPTIGGILGAPLVELRDAESKIDVGSTRLFRILMIESAYLIWKLRCARVCQNNNTPFTKIEVRRRWAKTMNERFDLDQQMTNGKYGKKALSKELVNKTWKLVRKDGAPPDGLGITGVLVGMTSTVRQGMG
ncbi:ribonuclease H-like domain-containing protein [Lyophyllum atratum]|nr:ribonuclease H-like domain-containing protein [Lyophyllum atratum]